MVVWRRKNGPLMGLSFFTPPMVSAWPSPRPPPSIAAIDDGASARRRRFWDRELPVGDPRPSWLPLGEPSCGVDGIFGIFCVFSGLGFPGQPAGIRGGFGEGITERDAWIRFLEEGICSIRFRSRNLCSSFVGDIDDVLRPCGQVRVFCVGSD